MERAMKKRCDQKLFVFQFIFVKIQTHNMASKTTQKDAEIYGVKKLSWVDERRNKTEAKAKEFFEESRRALSKTSNPKKQNQNLDCIVL
jgi:hypothetical protein